jgi:hypothetical protein
METYLTDYLIEMIQKIDMVILVAEEEVQKNFQYQNHLK